MFIRNGLMALMGGLAIAGLALAAVEGRVNRGFSGPPVEQFYGEAVVKCGASGSCDIMVTERTGRFSGRVLFYQAQLIGEQVFFVELGPKESLEKP